MSRARDLVPLRIMGVWKNLYGLVLFNPTLGCLRKSPTRSSEFNGDSQSVWLNETYPYRFLVDECASHVTLFVKARSLRSLLKYWYDCHSASSSKDVQFNVQGVRSAVTAETFNYPIRDLGVVDPELWLLYVTPSAKFLTADTPNQSQNKKCYT